MTGKAVTACTSFEAPSSPLGALCCLSVRTAPPPSLAKPPPSNKNNFPWSITPWLYFRNLTVQYQVRHDGVPAPGERSSGGQSGGEINPQPLHIKLGYLGFFCVTVRRTAPGKRNVAVALPPLLLARLP